MREFKFRAWDERGFWAKDFNVTRTGDILCTESRLRYEGVHKAKLHLMQYTGLKDKNGKEIYEGDIVRGAWNNDVYKVEMTFNWIHQYVEFGNEPLEVIGNIYENPNLIK